MQNSIEATASSLAALNQQYEAIANNLANTSTTGYKRHTTAFSQMLAARMSENPAATQDQLPYTVQGRASLDLSQGQLVQTGRPLDVALDGPGFLVIDTPEGPRYTRSGVLRTNAQGQLTDASGRIVAGEGGPLTVPPTAGDNLQISTDGTVQAGGATLGKLKLVEFSRPADLVPVGQNAYVAPRDMQPSAAQKTRVTQGYQESSNVNIAEELVGLITVSRLYEANVKAMTSQDDQAKKILNVAMG